MTIPAIMQAHPMSCHPACIQIPYLALGIRMRRAPSGRITVKASPMRIPCDLAREGTLGRSAYIMFGLNCEAMLSHRVNVSAAIANTKTTAELRRTNVFTLLQLHSSSLYTGLTSLYGAKLLPRVVIILFHFLRTLGDYFGTITIGRT